MSDAYTTAEAEKPGSSWSKKLFRTFILVASLIMCAELIWFLGITPFRPFSRIDISGFSYQDHETLLAYAGITSRSSFIFTNTREIESIISGMPQIESVRVFKRFPGRLEINLNTRKASAFTLVESGGVSVPVLFDRHGVIFQIGADSMTETFSDFPVISGLLIEHPVPGMRIPARFFPLLDELDSIRINAPELLSAISEIRIDRKSSEGFDLTLFLLHHKIRVRLSGINENILRYTLLIADVLAARDPEITNLDFRGAVASYYPQGGYL